MMMSTHKLIYIASAILFTSTGSYAVQHDNAAPQQHYLRARFNRWLEGGEKTKTYENPTNALTKLPIDWCARMHWGQLQDCGQAAVGR